MPKDTKRPPFEQLYARLEEHVAKLEQGGLSLEDAIALYEEGMTLARACQERLDDAEQRITKLKESFAIPPRDRESVSPAHDEDAYVDDSEPAHEDHDF